MTPVRAAVLAMLVALGALPPKVERLFPNLPHLRPHHKREALVFIEVPRTKQFSHVSPVVSDIESRLPQQHQYYDADPVTWVHEGTHYINSQIARQKGKQGLYLTNGKGVVLDHPQFTLADLAANIPAEDRRTIVQTYLVDQRQWWNAEPLYLLNEWVAYGNGCLCRKSLGQTGNTRIDTVRFFLEMEVYIGHLLKMAERDPGYTGMEELKSFVDWHSKRVREEVGPDDIALAETFLKK
jgi:hypothetical protein